MERQSHRRRRSYSSRFDEKGTPRTEGTAHASGVVSSDAILSDLVSTMPPMLYGLSITRAGTRFPLPRAGMPLSNVDLADTTQVSVSTLFGIFSFFDLFVI